MCIRDRILGHAPATVTKAIQQAAGNGTSYGAPTELEIQLATMIREALPSMEMVRLVSCLLYTSRCV